MTDNGLPILADGLFDGALAADVAPMDLRAAVNVLAVAGRPGSDAELASMAARVRQFSAEINAQPVTEAANRSGTQIATRALAHTTVSSINPRRSSDAVVFADTNRSYPMFATRITRKALSIVAITLLAAGTAAAAASGALPMFVEDSTEVVDDANTSVTDAPDVGDSDNSSESADDGAVVPPSVVSVVVNKNGEVDRHGKCTAWTHGAAKDATNPSFAELQVAADDAGLTIDEYCAAFLSSDHSDEVSDDDAGTADHNGSDKPENSRGDRGNSGNGNGDSGSGDSGNGDSGNGNSGSGNSGNGNGNSGNGNGNSGHGNSGNGNSGNSGHGAKVDSED